MFTNYDPLHSSSEDSEDAYNDRLDASSEEATTAMTSRSDAESGFTKLGMYSACAISKE